MQLKEVPTIVYLENVNQNERKVYLTPNGEIDDAALVVGFTIPEPGLEISASLNIGSAATPASAADLKNGYLNLVDKSGKEVYQNIPLYKGFAQRGNAGKMPLFLNLQKVDLKRCFLWFGQDITASQKYIIINFWVITH